MDTQTPGSPVSTTEWQKARAALAALDEALEALGPLLSKEAIHNAADDTGRRRVLALRTLATLAEEARRLHYGEGDSAGYEGAIPTPDQWLAWFNQQDVHSRQRICSKVVQNGVDAGDCARKDHEGQIAELVELVKKLNQAPPPIGTTVETIMINVVKNYADHLASGPKGSRDRQIGQELLRVIGASDG